MDGLRSINKRRRAFQAQPMKRSRRKFAVGGLVNPYEETYDRVTSQLTKSPTTDADTRTALSGDAVPRTEMPVGETPYTAAEGGLISPGKGDRQHPAGKALGKPGLRGGGLVSGPNRLVSSPGGMIGVSGTGAMTGMGAPRSRKDPRMATIGGAGAPTVAAKTPALAAFNPTLGGQMRLAGDNPLWKRPEPGSMVKMKRGGKAGLKGYQDGGLVDEEDEETKRLLARAPVPVPTPAPTPIMSPEEREPIGRAFESDVRSPAAMLESNIEARQQANLAAAGRAPQPTPSALGAGETGDTGREALRPTGVTPAQTPLEKAFGLRAGAKRTEVEGSPGVTKYKDAAGKTLYSNVDFDVKGVAPTPEMVKEAQARAKADSEKLSGFVAARAASGHPADIEAARRIAVTPADYAAVNDAEALAGLRARASRPGAAGRAATLELQGRQAQQVEGLRGARALQVAMLGRTPTPLQVAQHQLAVKADERAGRTEARTAEQQRYERGVKETTDAFASQFAPDEKGKAEHADFMRNFHATIPSLQAIGGDPSKLTSGHRALFMALNEVKKNVDPSGLGSYMPGASPGSRNLLHYAPKKIEDGFWNKQIRTRGGQLKTFGQLTGGKPDIAALYAALGAEAGVDVGEG